MEILQQFVMGAWSVLLDSAIYILFGFFIAGLLKAFLPTEFIAKHLGGEAIGKAGKKEHATIGPVFKAALFGVPLPLCSCGVIPAAAGLREQGASKGATTAFLIATPETGVDSMTVTYGLLDPIMTIVRPLSAFITSVAAGIAVDILDKNDITDDIKSKKSIKTSSCCCNETKPEPKPASTCCCSDKKAAPQGAFASQMFAAPIAKQQAAPTTSSCCCSDTPKAPQTSSCCSSEKIPPKATTFEKFKVGMSFAYGKLIADIGMWLLIGISLASLIGIFIPEDMFTDTVTGFSGMVVMMAIGIPMYVCATASTPIAAAFALKGISPGAALVFLLAGPATNVATITVVAKMLGKRAAFIYVTTIAIMTLLIGMFVNYLYVMLGLSVTDWVTVSIHQHHSIFSEIAAVVLVLLILVQWTKKWRAKNTSTSSCCSSK